MEFYTCIAKYAFFGIRDEKLLATARKSWYHTMVCSGIEAVITGLTRNHVSTLKVQTAEKPVTMRVCGQVQIVNWGLFYPVVLPNFHGLNFAGKWL